MAVYEPAPGYGPYHTLARVVRRGSLQSGEETSQTLGVLFKNGYLKRKIIGPKFFLYMPTKKALKYIKRMEIDE